MAVGAFEQMEGKSMSQYAIYPSLRERVVIVTGGGSGIGAKLVEHFAHQGAKVAFLDVAEHASRELIDSLAAGHLRVNRRTSAWRSRGPGAAGAIRDVLCPSPTSVASCRRWRRSPDTSEPRP